MTPRYLDIALAFNPLCDKSDESDKKRTVDTERPPNPDLWSHMSLMSQPQANGFNVVLRVPWQPAWYCPCGASVGGEWPLCLLCGESKPGGDVAS